MIDERVELEIAEVREYEVGNDEEDEVEDNDGEEVEDNDELLQDFTFELYQQQTRKSAKRYASGVDRYMAWLELMGERAKKDYPESVIGVGRGVIHEYFSWLSNTKWGVATRKSYFAAVQQFYKWIEQTGKGEDITESYSIDEYTLEPGELEKNRLQTADDDDYLWIPREEVELLWHPDYVPAPRTLFELAFKLMWYTTARGQAITDIEIDNIDREKGEILIPNLKPGDDEPPYRTVVYPVERIEPLLAEWLDRGRRETLGMHTRESSYLFPSLERPRKENKEIKLRPSFLSKKVRGAAQDAGINEVLGTDANGKTRWKVTSHTLRHSSITYLANQTTTPIHLVSRQAGHSQLSTTLSYVHDDDEAFRRELQNAWE